MKEASFYYMGRAKSLKKRIYLIIKSYISQFMFLTAPCNKPEKGFWVGGQKAPLIRLGAEYKTGERLIGRLGGRRHREC